jgi:Arc/MetJ-type ribon-helix-helix transcriptional regulator
MAEVIERKIKSGAYASVSEVMRDGVRASLERDAAVERWLREERVAGQKDLADCSCGGCGPRKASRRARLGETLCMLSSRR